MYTNMRKRLFIYIYIYIYIYQLNIKLFIQNNVNIFTLYKFCVLVYFICPLLTSSIHCATVFPDAFAQKWTPRNWLWPNSLVFGCPHFWQRNCCGICRFLGVKPCAAAAAAASANLFRRHAVVLGTLLTSGAANGTGAPATGTGAAPTGRGVAVDAAGTGAVVDVCAAAGTGAEAGMVEVAKSRGTWGWEEEVEIGGGWPWERGAACPDASWGVANSKDECPCWIGSGSFGSTGGSCSEATKGAVKGSMSCCNTSLSCLFIRALCLCTEKTTISICV